MNAKWENLGISNDFLFGKVMQDSELCKGLLQRILQELEIDRIEYHGLQKGINLDADAKSVRLDVYIKDGKGTVYDIEMQATETGELPKRTRYYQSMVDLQMIDKGMFYKQLKPSYIIFICPFDLYGTRRHIYIFENFCREDKDILLGDETVKIFLNADGRLDDVSKELRAFLDYVAGKSIKCNVWYFFVSQNRKVSVLQVVFEYRDYAPSWRAIGTTYINDIIRIVRLIQDEENVKITWYMERPTDEQWKENYEGIPIF